jgi:hypothetical protein
MRKYIRPAGTKSRLYVPRNVWPFLDDIGQPLFITEGEKKAAKASQEGFFTVAISGVWNWSSNNSPIEDLDIIKWSGRRVYLVFDADKQSNKSVLLAEERLAEVLTTKGADVRIIDLPRGMKLDDFLIGHGVSGFEKLIESARTFLGDKSMIVDPGDVRDVTEKSWEVIRRENKRRPQIFRFGNALAVLEQGERGSGYRITSLDNYILRHYLIRWVSWYFRRGDHLRPYVHSITVLEDIRAIAEQDLPWLNGVTSTPVFASDGTLVVEPGYCEKTGLFYAPLPDFILQPISEKPTATEIELAKKLILDELFGNFPFADDAARSHSVALLLLSFARNLIDGPTPFHLIGKATPGTGASLMARAISHVCTGGDFTVFPEGRDGEEFRKRLTAVLMTAPLFLVLDNLNRILNSSALATVLTQTYWEDRVLGQSKHLRVPVRCAWVGTGNNPVMSYEITRRTVGIRLDAKMEAPFLRKPDQFRHPDLLLWIKENRAALVNAVLTLIQHWIVSGRPKSSKSLGGFEAWAAVVGGVLECAGIPGFLSNTKELFEDVQTEQEQKRLFVAAWFKKFGEKDIRAGDLLRIPGINELIPDSGEGGGDRSTKTKLGFFIKQLKDQVFSLDHSSGVVTIVIRRSKRRIENSTAWKLEVVKRTIKVKRENGK